MSMISEQIKELREIAKNWNPNTPINPVSVVLDKAADTIESLSAKLQAANMEKDQRLDNGWVYCDEWLPSMVEYMELEPTPHMKRIEVAYMTDSVEYLIGFYDGSKWMDKHHNIIKNVIAWKPFVKLSDKHHEP